MRSLAALLAVLCFAAPLPARSDKTATSDWPLLRAYAAHFITADGRVVDHTGGAITTSEGQSYALFFALVDGDRGLFESLLRWTQDNLAGGDLAHNLPSTSWGRKPDGKWGVLDPNSAADSDLWIGYVLVEAGRLWANPGYARVGRQVLANIVAREVVPLPGVGPMLLPAPRGFQLNRDTWRLNPSYLPPQLLLGIAAEGVPGPWLRIHQNTLRLIAARARDGYIADWIAFQRKRGFVADPITGKVGSYDAIRTYLWASLLDDKDADKARLGKWLSGMRRAWRQTGEVPERVPAKPRAATSQTGQTGQPGEPGENSAGPVGFLAVLLPGLHATDQEAWRRLKNQIEEARSGDLYGKPATYYDQNLILFAQGFDEGRYRFAVDGRLILPTR